MRVAKIMTQNERKRTVKDCSCYCRSVFSVGSSMLLSGIHFIINYLLYIVIRMDNILKIIYVSHLLCFAYCELRPTVWPIRLVIYCRNLQLNLRQNCGVEFYLAKLLIRSRNQGVECGSNPGSDSRWPNLMSFISGMKRTSIRRQV